jgi:outer membrane beta-barrel protein
MALLGSTAVAAPALGQEIQIHGPLAGASAVSRLVHYREHRLVLTPTFGITLQDEFTRELFTGLRAEYYFNDWLGLGIWGAYAAAHVDTSLTDQVVSRSASTGNPLNSSWNGGSNTTNVPYRNNFPMQIGRRNWVMDLHLTFVPLRGKFALFQNVVANVDFFIFAGPALIGVEERSDFANNSTDLTNADQHNDIIRAAARNVANGRTSRVAVTGTFGFGLNFYINRWISLNFEYRAMPFAWNTSGTDENTTRSLCGAGGHDSCSGFSDLVVTQGAHTVIDSNDRSLRMNQMVNFGLSFYLPGGPRIGP